MAPIPNRTKIIIGLLLLLSLQCAFASRRHLKGGASDGGNEEVKQSSNNMKKKTKKSHESTKCPGFSIICLGPYGGLDQAFVTSFLVKGNHDDAFVSLDGGTTLSGIQAAVEQGAFDGIIPNELPSSMTEVGYVFLQGIKAYLLTHPHQDHNIGLTISATDDVAQGLKPVFGTDFTMSSVQDVWDWKAWPNFGDGGNQPLNTYSLQTIQADGSTVYSIDGTGISFTAFPLQHGNYPDPDFVPYPSTAYLVEYAPTESTEYHSCTSMTSPKVLFFGDTGADSINKTTYMEAVWRSIAKYVADGSLHAILLECAYTDSRADSLLFGHLKPSLFVQELVALRSIIEEEYPEQNANYLLSHVKVIVQHVKPESMLFEKEETTSETVLRELQAWSRKENLMVDYILPTPGGRYNTF